MSVPELEPGEQTRRRIPRPLAALAVAGAVLLSSANCSAGDPPQPDQTITTPGASSHGRERAALNILNTFDAKPGYIPSVLNDVIVIPAGTEIYATPTRDSASIADHVPPRTFLVIDRPRDFVDNNTHWLPFAPAEDNPQNLASDPDKIYWMPYVPEQQATPSLPTPDSGPPGQETWQALSYPAGTCTTRLSVDLDREKGNLTISTGELVDIGYNLTQAELDEVITNRNLAPCESLVEILPAPR